LKKQLIENGKMLIPIGNKQTQTMKIVTKTTGDKFVIEDVPYFAFVPLIGKEGWKE